MRSPDAAGTGTANLARSNGFEGMALSGDGRTLYPVLEGPVAGDDPLVRRVYAFDLDRKRYRGDWREYRVARQDLLVSDFTLRDDERFVSLERDNAEGLAARHKQAFEVTLTPRGRCPSGASPTCSTSATRPASRCRRAQATSAWATRSRCPTRRSKRSCRSARTGRDRQRHELRLTWSQPRPAGLQRLRGDLHAAAQP